MFSLAVVTGTQQVSRTPYLVEILHYMTGIS